jgi:hypothetical protein
MWQPDRELASVSLAAGQLDFSPMRMQNIAGNAES